MPRLSAETWLGASLYRCPRLADELALAREEKRGGRVGGKNADWSQGSRHDTAGADVSLKRALSSTTTQETKAIQGFWLSFDKRIKKGQEKGFSCQSRVADYAVLCS